MNEWELGIAEIAELADIFEASDAIDTSHDIRRWEKTVAREAQKKLVEWLISKRVEGYHGGFTCSMVTMDTFKDLCKALGTEETR